MTPEELSRILIGADKLDEIAMGEIADLIRTKFQFQRIVEVAKAPDPSDEDQSGQQMRFVLIGPRGAVQFVLMTNWRQAWLSEQPFGRMVANPDDLFLLPYPADLGYHSPKPMYPEQSSTANCPYLNGQPCYYDGGGLNAVRVFRALLKEGHEAVWKILEDYYRSTFHSEEE